MGRLLRNCTRSLLFAAGFLLTKAVAAASTNYYPMVESPVPLKIVSTRCNRESNNFYEREYKRLSEPHVKLGSGGSAGLLALSLAGVAMQARGAADEYLKECMIVNGWSSDPTDEYRNKSLVEAAIHSEAIANRIIALLDAKDFITADILTSDWVRREPTSFVAHAYHGAVLSAKKSYMEALKSYQKSIELGETHPQTWLNMANAMRHTGATRDQILGVLSTCKQLSMEGQQHSVWSKCDALSIDMRAK